MNTERIINNLLNEMSLRLSYYEFEDAIQIILTEPLSNNVRNHIQDLRQAYIRNK